MISSQQVPRWEASITHGDLKCCMHRHSESAMHNVFTSWTIFCRCFCLRCWHSNTNYARNITPTYKSHYYPMRGGILADVCSALLFFHRSRRRASTHSSQADTTDPLSRCTSSLRCLSLSNAGVCLVLSLHLSAPPIARDIYFIYIFQCGGGGGGGVGGFSANGSFHALEPQSQTPGGNH